MPVLASGRALSRPLSYFLSWATSRGSPPPLPVPRASSLDGEQVLLVFDIDQSLLK